jgi:uracil-DNA glycosylase
VCLGATAAQALLGRDFRVTRQHGRVLASDLGPTLATIHPSAILRAGAEREGLMAQLVSDLRAAAEHLGAAKR